MTDNSKEDDLNKNDDKVDNATVPRLIPTVNKNVATKAQFWSGFFLGIGFAFIVGFGGCMLILSSF